MLSAAGIYALMSFTITRRRREIGIRAALGAGPRFVLQSILARAGAQIGIGVALGLAAARLMRRGVGGVTDGIDGRDAALLVTVTLLMAAVGFMAALGSARRHCGSSPPRR